MKKKLLVFSIDCATWDLILPWVRKNKLKGFKKIVKEGNYATLQSTIPFISPCAWTTISTGTTPSQHGIYDFYKLKTNGEIDVNTSLDVKYPYVWEILSKLGKKVAVYNIPLTYPPQKVNGIMITDFTTPDLKSDFIFPKKYKKVFIKETGDYFFTPRFRVIKGDQQSYQSFFNDLVLWLENGLKVCDWFLKMNNFDLIFINLMSVDQVQHFYWNFFEKKRGKYKDAIFNIYKIIDNYLLKLLKNYSDDYQIIILSDHGAGKLEGEIFLNYWLYKKGYLKFKKNFLVYLKRILNFFDFNFLTITKIAKLFQVNKKFGEKNFYDRIKILNFINNFFLLSTKDIDRENSLAYSFGEYNGIYLNKSLNNKNKLKLIKKISTELKNDFKGIPVEVYIIEKYYGPKKHDKFPDLIPIFKKGAYLGINLSTFFGRHIMSKLSIYQKTGDHRQNGIFALYPKFFSKNKLPDVSALDITPTILDFFDIKKGTYMVGKSIFRMYNNLSKNVKKNYSEIDDLEI